MATKNQHRAACVATLYILDRQDYLEGLSLREIANLLDLSTRSTALRYMRDVHALREMVPELLEKVRNKK